MVKHNYEDGQVERSGREIGHGKGIRLPILKHQWDADTHTLLLKFENYSEGVNVKINW